MMHSVAVQRREASPRPRLRRLGGKVGSIREVRLIGLAGAGDPDVETGGRLGWWGRSYEVVASEGRPEGASAVDRRYLHLRPAGP